MGKRLAILIGVAALGAAVIAAGASADFTSGGDPRGDTLCFHEVGHQPCSDSKRRNADIVRATAGHDGTLLKHTIRVVGKIHAVQFEINTDSDRGCEFILLAGLGYRDDVRECTQRGRVTGPARYDFHRHSVEIFFSKESIGNPQSYGWHALTESLGKDYLAADAADFFPNGRAYIQHRLGDSGAAAAGVMALGAQTAAAAPDVVNYETELTITTDRGFLYHGGVISEVGKCMEGRRVTLFKQRPGADRKLATDRSEFVPRYHQGEWEMPPRLPGLDHTLPSWNARIYARVKRAEREGYVCLADRSPTI